MQLYSETGDFKLYHGDMLDMLQVIAPCSIDSIITDPPYGLTTITKRFGNENAAPNQYGRDGSFARLTKGFMGKEWDGSGSTGKAAMYENKDRNAGYKYIGIELTAEYLPIADARIRYAAGDNTPIEPKDMPAEGQITFFDLLGGETKIQEVQNEH